MPPGLYDDTPDFDDGFDDGPEDALDPEGPSAADLERFGDPTHTCPECGAEVYEDSELCHICGHMFERPARAKSSPLVLMITVVLVLALLLLFVF
jgi:predicted nucleic acid-binding Zn ribbon protein